MTLLQSAPAMGRHFGLSAHVHSVATRSRGIDWHPPSAPVNAPGGTLRRSQETSATTTTGASRREYSRFAPARFFGNATELGLGHRHHRVRDRGRQVVSVRDQRCLRRYLSCVENQYSADGRVGDFNGGLGTGQATGSKRYDSPFRSRQSVHQQSLPALFATAWSQNQYGTSPDLCRQRVCRKRVRTAQTGIGAPLLVSYAARSYRKDQSLLLKRLQSLATKAQSRSKKRERQTHSRQGPTVKFVDQKVTKKLSPKPCSDPSPAPICRYPLSNI